MSRVFKMKEIKIVTKVEPGMLVRLSAPIAKAKINIGAFCMFEKNDTLEFYLITADNEKVKKSLEQESFSFTERDVIVVETANESGTLLHAAEQLAQTGVQLERSYSTAGNFGTSWVIFATRKISK